MLTNFASVAGAERREEYMQEQRQAYRAVIDERRASRMLTLDGWSTYRDRLIEVEHEQKRLGLDEVALSEASPRVVVQDGEGYRPMLLSWQLSRQRSAQESE